MKQSIDLIEEREFMRYQELARDGGVEASVALIVMHIAQEG